MRDTLDRMGESVVIIEETHINTTRDRFIGEVPPTESDLTLPITRAVFRELMEEHGRCVSKVFRDREGAPPEAIGYVFQRRAEYDGQPRNCAEPETYIHETWVTFREAVESGGYDDSACGRP